MNRPLPLLAVCLLLFCGCSDADRKPVRKMAGDAFKVGFDKDFAPFTFQNDSGEYVGYDLDLAQEVARRNSWRYIPVPMDWRIKEILINSGKVDCIWSSFHMNNRESLFEWSRPYTIGKQVVVALKDSPFRSIDDLSGKQIAIQTGCINYDSWVSNSTGMAIPKTKGLIQVDGFSPLMSSFTEKGAFDAVITDETAINWWKQAHGDNLKVIGAPVLQTPCGVAFRRGNTELRDQVQQTLVEMARDGTLARLSRQWFGRDITCPELAAETK